MDNQSVYTWKLTSDEMTTIWYALVDYKNKACANQEQTTDASMKQVYSSLASKSYDLIGQINRLRSA